MSYFSSFVRVAVILGLNIGLASTVTAGTGGRLEGEPGATEQPQTRQAPAVGLINAFPSLNFPQIISLNQRPGSNRWYAVQKTGVIRTFSQQDGSDLGTFLDLSDIVNSQPSEAGLLGMAWHPTREGEFYLSYTVPSAASPANLRSVIARYRTADGLTARVEGEVLLTVEQPFRNHNGGHIAFGPDGYLYIGFGDGGSAGDPLDNAQNLEVLLGKILRIDVNATGRYAIPTDNPFVGTMGVRPEIYAYGLRNPWRYSFDRETGDLWLGDVGQNMFEEINIINPGGNYGWNATEGFVCFAAPNCSSEKFVAPVIDYGREDGASVTGGYVYRGEAIPALEGQYVYADFVSGNIWRLETDANGARQAEDLLTPGINISSFAEDHEGELYVLEYNRGSIYKIVNAAATND